MLRKMMIALLATAAVAMLAPDVASAQRGFGGGGGGGFRGGGFGGGGGFRGAAIGGGGGFRAAAIGGGGFRAAPMGGGFRAAAIGGGGFRAAPMGGGFRTAPMGGGFRGQPPYGPDGRRLSCGPDGRQLSYSRNWREWVPPSRHWCRHWLPHRSDRWTRRDWPWRRRRVRSIRKRGARSISPRPLSPPTPPAANLRDDRIWPRTVRSLPLLRRLLSVRLQ